MKLKQVMLAVIVGAVGVTFATPLQPSATPAETRQTIQAALDGMGSGGTVELGEGTFEIDVSLSAANGVTLKGQGWEKTTIRQTGAKQRVATLDGGAKLVGVTVTGGRVSDSWAGTAGVQVNDGTISWCRITENKATGRNSWGGGVAFSKGAIDHTIIDHNQGGDYSGGGGISVREPAGEIVVDTCLVYCNTAPHGQGGGFYASLANYHKSLTVRNLTIVGNTAGTDAGGFYMAENGNASSLSLVNCIFADNTAGSGDANLAFFTYSSVESIRNSCASKSFGNVFDNGTELGENSKSVAGSGAAWFADAANGDCRLVSGAAPVGAGTWYEGIAEDLDRVGRNNPPAAGCYEFGGVVPTVVANPTFSPAATSFTQPLDVTLACDTDGATIHYTTDGSDPTAESAVYRGAIRVTETTTIKAFAVKADLDPSEIVAATYTYVEPDPPEPPTLGSVSVTAKATKATFSGTVTSVGNNGATSCDVYLALDGGAAEKVASDVAGSFRYEKEGLVPETAYAWILSVSNNATVVMGASASGEFTTPVQPDPHQEIQPGETPEETRQTIQAAIDAAAEESPAGTVTLGEGTFELDAQLTVHGGVTLIGQGWEKTIIRQTAFVRVMTVSGGAKVEGVTVTGGHVRGEFNTGGGASVEDGTISKCRVTGNQTGDAVNVPGIGGKQMNGGGISIKKGVIDHTVIASNAAYANGGGNSNAGGIYIASPTGPITVDACLICGNRAPNGYGGGVVLELGNYHQPVTFRNSTIAGNSTAGEAGAVYFQENGNKCNLSLVNCLIASNSGTGNDSLVKFAPPADTAIQKAICASQSFGNVFDGGVSLGANSMTVADSGAAWFANAAENDYHLVSGAVPVGAGKWYDGLGSDLDGVDFNKEEPSVGCYEFSGPVVEKTGVIFIIW